MLFRLVALVMFVVCSAVPALPAQQAVRSRAPDIPLSPLTVEGGGGKSAAAHDVFLRAVGLVDRQQRDSALLAFQEAARLARQATDSVTLADAQYRAGFLLWQRGKYEAAIPFLDSARAVRLVIGDDAELARVVNALGASHYQLGIYEPAIDAFEFALRLRRQGTDTAGLVRTLSNIGKAYHDWDQYANAHRTLTEAIALAGALPERASALGYALNSRAMVNIDREAYQEARQDIAASRAAYARYFAFYPKADTVDAWELNLGAEGLLALREQRPRDAIALLEPVRASAERRGSARAQGRALLHLGDGFTQLAQSGQARTLFQQALDIGTAANQRTLMLAALNRLADLEEKAGNQSEALRLLREYNTLWNVIFDQDASLRITTREAHAATDAALQANREQQLVIERQRLTMTLGVVIFGLVLALLFLIVRFSARERARVRALASANEGLVTLNAELSTALAEVKTLSGLIPICANCKRIRDDRGYWSQVESYLERYSDARFSHSICQSCGPELYGDYWTDSHEVPPHPSAARPPAP